MFDVKLYVDSLLDEEELERFHSWFNKAYPEDSMAPTFRYTLMEVAAKSWYASKTYFEY